MHPKDTSIQRRKSLKDIDGMKITNKPKSCRQDRSKLRKKTKIKKEKEILVKEKKTRRARANTQIQTPAEKNSSFGKQNVDTQSISYPQKSNNSVKNVNINITFPNPIVSLNVPIEHLVSLGEHGNLNKAGSNEIPKIDSNFDKTKSSKDNCQKNDNGMQVKKSSKSFTLPLTNKIAVEQVVSDTKLVENIDDRCPNGPLNDSD